MIPKMKFIIDRWEGVAVYGKEKEGVCCQNIPVNPYKTDFAYGLYYGNYDVGILVYELYASVALL